MHMDEFKMPASELTNILYEFVVPARMPWSRVIKAGQTLRIIDLEGQQAVDFLCYNAGDLGDRYSSMNTIKVQGNAYIGKGTVLYSDSGVPLLTVVADSLGRHDTIYGCCSIPNNRLRYGVKTTESCYTNFANELGKHGLDRSAIVGNVNFFMQVPITADGAAGVAADVSSAGSFVDLRAETDVLAVLSNCPQMHNPCNAYNPTPVKVIVRGAA
jgi:urea carboxylase-associated protein 1